MGRIVYITGGSRSGKSSYAQKLAEEHVGDLLYVATAEVRDDEMAVRVGRHQAERGERWQVLEEPLQLAEAIPPAAGEAAAILIDCLTLWLSNQLEEYGDKELKIYHEATTLIEALRQLNATTYIVSNELGSGIVPENRVARTFRDLAGLLNQKIAEAADEAWLVVSGLPLKLK
ncbi:MAG: bifunctional adenosylcobinamide kinase/adenosylcobinamide-phosphate guanylyltransferase [Desulfuromonas sp.]|nr:MAG: bifunctional adenosylcobinamide kinase/adenosylcobinamide-phosphate guanylyltransferase [Desulfuromonas sp.]